MEGKNSMNRTQRAKVKMLRGVQNSAKEMKNSTISIGRHLQDLKCDAKREKKMRRMVTEYKVAIKNEKEAITA